MPLKTHRSALKGGIVSYKIISSFLIAVSFVKRIRYKTVVNGAYLALRST